VEIERRLAALDFDLERGIGVVSQRHDLNGLVDDIGRIGRDLLAGFLVPNNLNPVIAGVGAFGRFDFVLAVLDFAVGLGAFFALGSGFLDRKEHDKTAVHGLAVQGDGAVHGKAAALASTAAGKQR